MKTLMCLFLRYSFAPLAEKVEEKNLNSENILIILLNLQIY